MTRKRFGPYTVELSREDKLLFPDAEVTKGDVIRYYQEVAEPLLRHIQGRPVTLQRFPDGISQEGFYQKATPEYFPEWISRIRIPLEEGGSQEQVLVSNAAGLAYLANQGVLTLHAWLSQRDHLRTPDRMVFDLDPPDESFEPVRKAAGELRDLLQTLGLRPFLMVTGSTGAHVWVPIRRGPDFESVREFARRVAHHLAQAHPDTLTTQLRKDKRGGRLFLDVGRNGYGQTAVAPYSLRPRRRASVATPLDWDELEDPRLAGDSFTIQSIPRRLDQRSDPWKGMGRHQRSLDGPGKTLEKIVKKG